jgi:AmiR/NasT family two-component response regulator
MPADEHLTHLTHPPSTVAGDPDADLRLVAQQLTEVTEKVEHLTRAVQSRDVIGQAKGILMERYGITSEQAFQLLVVASSTSNSKLAAVAAHLTDTGVLERPPGS